MKKVTIITPLEYESLVLESLGKAGVTQLKHVTGEDFERLREDSGTEVDFATLYENVHTSYQKLLELGEGKIELVSLDNDALRKFMMSPDIESNAALDELERLIASLEEVKKKQIEEKKTLVNEIKAKTQKQISTYEEEKNQVMQQRIDLEQEKLHLEESINQKFEETRVRLESVRALEPDEFKRCFAVGLIENTLISQIEEYLKRYQEIFYKPISVTPEKSFLFIFGPESGRKWVESLFLVFEVEDVFDVLDTKDILLVLDPKKRKEIIEKYSKEVKRVEEEKGEQAERERKLDTDIRELDEKKKDIDKYHEKKLSELKNKYELKLKTLDIEHKAQIENIKKEQAQIFGKVSYVDYTLGILSNSSETVLRSNIISVLQGWVPDRYVDELEEAVHQVENQTGEQLFYQFEDPSHDDHNIPNPEPKMPKILQPTWTLTKLRGWPSAMEIDPSLISVFVFSFQFGLMYGDIGQGALFLVLGLYFSKKYTKGLPYRLGGLMVPMGISAIIFGFAYDSIFLIEHAISHALHDAHIQLPFHYPIMPNPVLETTKLMLIVFQIAMLEIVFGLVLGAMNQIKAGNPVGALGEHGLGMILYVVGLYQTAMYFISIGMDFMTALGSPWFLICIAGMLLSFLEPVIHSVQHGHGIGMEAIGEGVGGLLMTFVEGLANMFSFLRIAAFALAHASLAIAAEALTHSLGLPLGLPIMNIIALSFEFVSSTVQSLRLLYYEFMGKFFQGGGIPFTPYRLRVRQTK